MIWKRSRRLSVTGWILMAAALNTAPQQAPAQQAPAQQAPAQQAPAQQAPAQQAPAQPTSAPQAETPSAIGDLALYPASSPDPLLRYRLWPEAALRKRENATAIVSRALILSLKVPAEKQEAFGNRFQDWNELPIDQLPVDEVQRLLDAYRSTLNELERVENLMQVDYALDLDDLTAAEMVQTLLPELQEMRTLARILSLRARLAAGRQDWDAMVNDCRLGFRLAEVAGYSTDFLIGRLVGFAIAGTMMGVLEEAIQQPGCPNLYWALASIPAEHLFETRESLEYESVLITRIFRGVGPLPDHPIGASAAREKLRTMVDQANRTLRESSTGGTDPGTGNLLAGAYVVVMADASRDLLAATPQWGNRAYELSAPEAVLRASILKFTRARDQWVAWSLLPPEVWHDRQAEQNRATEFPQTGSDMLVGLVNMLTPAVSAARIAGLRSHQQRNWLMTIEAVRMHAAQYGELPNSLEQLLPVPGLPDTLNHRAFGYQRSTPTQAILTRAARYADDPETTYRIELKGTE